MSWVRLDDNLNEHPKVAALNHEEFHLWLSALVLASHLLYALPDADAEPGFLTDPQIQALARQKLCQFRAVKGLVRQGLFEEVDGGIHIHDFEQYLAPDWEAKRDRLREISEIRRNAGQIGGRRSVAARRAASGTAQPKQTPKQTSEFASSDDRPAPKQTPKQTGSKLEAPVPVPVPVTESLVLLTEHIADPTVGGSAAQRVFEVWKRETGRTGRTVLNAQRQRLLRRALTDYDEADLLDAVRGWRHDPWPDRPQHTELEVVLRPANLEKFRDWERNGPPLIPMPEARSRSEKLSRYYRARRRSGGVSRKPRRPSMFRA